MPVSIPIQSTSVGIKMDLAQWPVVVVSPPPEEVTDEQFSDFMEQFRSLVKSRRDRYGIVLDLRNSPGSGLSPRQRRILTDSMSEDKEFSDAYCACTAMVFESPLLRGVLTAIFWVFTPEYPTKVFRQYDDALKWAQGIVIHRLD